MKNKFILIILILLLALPVLCLNNKNKPVSKSKESINFKDIKKNNILVSNIKIINKKDKYYFTAKITNLSTDKLKMSPIEIILRQNSEDIKLIGYIGDWLDAKKSQNILIETKQPLKDVLDIDISVQDSVTIYRNH